MGWYDTGAPPPSLAEAKGSAHTWYSVLLWWWRRWWWWWRRQFALCFLQLRLDFHQPSIFFHIVGGAGRHDAWLDKSDRKQQEKRAEDFFAIQWLTGSGSIYRLFILGDKQTVEKWSPERVLGGHNPPGHARQAWRALVSCAHQGMLPGSFFIS